MTYVGAEAIYSCLSHLTQLPPSSKYLLLLPSYNLLSQRLHLTLLILATIGTQVTFVWIPGHINLPEHEVVGTSSSQRSYHIHKNHRLHPSSCIRLHTLLSVSHPLFLEFTLTKSTQKKASLHRVTPLFLDFFHKEQEKGRHILIQARMWHTHLSDTYSPTNTVHS